MLNILTGPDRKVLTDTVMRKIGDSAASGKAGQILIVPEQFSHEAERRLCMTCGDTISRFAEVLSFSRLSDRLAACHGGTARAYLDKGGQLLSMALAAEQASSRIKLYGAVLRKPEFLSDMVRMISEFRSYCLTPDMLMDAAREEDGLFSQKLEELSLLYEAYLAVCSNGRADPSDKLLRLIDVLFEGDWACGKTFYLDGFSDFTGAELAALEGLLLHADQVIVTLPSGAPNSITEQLCLDSMLLLRRTAEKKEIPCSVLSVNGASPRHPDVQHLLHYLLTSQNIQPKVSDAIVLRAYSSVEEECRGAVVQIKALLTNGARCRDISVACTDMAAYGAPLEAAFRSAGLPVYFAGAVDLLSKPLIGAVINSLIAASGPMDYEDVALYLKSGLPIYERDRCDRLDNYAYLWNLRGSQWEKPWELHPRGFGEGWSDEDRVLIEQLNRDKTAALSPLFELRKALLSARNTGDMVLALHRFLEGLQLRERLEAQANIHANAGNGQLAQELLQMYEILCTSLEQVWLTLRDTTRTPEDFCHLYQMLLTQYQIATIPAGLDQVHVSSLPDLRHRSTGHLIVLGASDGLMPAYKTAEGLLTEEERRKLLDHGLVIAPGRAEQMDQEMGRIFSALTSAEYSFSLSYAGEQPAWLFRRAESLYPESMRQVTEEAFLQMEDLAAWKLRNGNHEELPISSLRSVEEQLQRHRSYTFSPLKRKTVHQLYGTPIALSPSKIDTFAACRLEYFLDYGLKAKPRKQAKLDQPAFGTFVHAVLEHTVRRVMELGGFEKVDSETVLQIASEEIKAYANEFIPVQAERDAYLFQRSETEIREIVLDLWEELRVSKFRPAYCELKFARDGMLPLITVQGKQTDCQIMGLVDRVDLFENDDGTYVRIVDYKTGVKNFDYTDVLNGAGLQMLIYLFALRAFGKDYLGTAQLEPAGVLYLPAKKEYPLTEPLPDDGLVEKEHLDRRKRKGLIRSDEQLLSAMEADPSKPRYMPYKVGRSGLSGDLADQRQMVLLERHVIRTVADMADQMAGGDISPNPMVRGQLSPCRYCDYKTVCHKDLGLQQPRNLAETSAKEFWERLEKEEQNHG